MVSDDRTAEIRANLRRDYGIQIMAGSAEDQMLADLSYLLAAVDELNAELVKAE